MMLLLSLAMAYAGFAALCLSMQRHQRDVLARSLPARWIRPMRIIGYALLSLTYVTCAIQTAPSVGILLWAGVLSAAAFLLVSMLAWKARHVLWSAPAALMAALLLQGLNG